MYATLVIQFPTTATGIPIISMEKMLKNLLPDLHHAVEEAVPRGRKIIPLNDKTEPVISSSVSWAIDLHAEIGV